MKDKLDAFIDGVHHLPPSPRLLIKLLEVSKQPDKDIHEIVKLISHDPSFTAEILKRCNSAYFGTEKPVEDMFEAVSRLGLQEIYNVVLAMFAATALLRPEKGGTMHVELLWRHSVAVAVAAGVLAQAVGESQPAAFTAGLLHDAGKVVMVSASKVRYTEAMENAGRFKRSMIVAEKEVFGFDHAEAGARLLTRWQLPPNIVAAVRHHHDPTAAEPFTRLAATVHLANLIAHATGEKLTGELKLNADLLNQDLLQLDLEKINTLLPAMQEGLAKAKSLMPA